MIKGCKTIAIGYQFVYSKKGPNLAYIWRKIRSYLEYDICHAEGTLHDIDPPRATLKKNKLAYKFIIEKFINPVFLS